VDDDRFGVAMVVFMFLTPLMVIGARLKMEGKEGRLSSVLHCSSAKGFMIHNVLRLGSQAELHPSFCNYVAFLVNVSEREVGDCAVL